MRRSPPLAATLAVILAIPIAVGGLFLWSAGNHRETATQAVTVRAEAYGLSQLEWHAVADGKVGEHSRAELAQREARFTAMVAQLDQAGVDPERTRALRKVGAAYSIGINAMFVAIAAGEMEAAEVIDEEQVDPAFSQIDELTEAISVRADQRARVATNIALVLCLVLLFLTAGAVLELLRRTFRRILHRERTMTEAAAAARFAAMVQDSTDAVLTDTVGNVVFATPALSRLIGREPSNLLGTVDDEVVLREDADEAAAALARVAGTSGTRASVEFRVTHSDGNIRFVEAQLFNATEDAAIAGVVWNIRDVTDRRQLEQRVAHQAFHDAVTGVANRALLSDRSALAVARAARAGTRPAMLLLDLDDFKDINDALGHAAGDQLLRAIATRLQDHVRSGDLVARFGGDEFAVLLEDCSDTEEALELAGRLRAAVCQPVEVMDQFVRVTASVGVVIRTDQDGDELLRCADLAMYAAKRRGKDAVGLFEPSMRTVTEERVQLTAELREAVAEGQIRLVFQPIVDLRDGQVTGFEALARWDHPERGVIPPLTFIPMAEESGAILEIGRHVLHAACTQLRAWTEHSQYPYSMSVNVSGRQLADAAFRTQVDQILILTGIRPEQLVLEITESVVIEDVIAARSRLAALRRLGLRVALDDFGTGYSSLSYLRSLPVDILKIDKSFVDDDVSVHGAELLAGIVALGKALDLQTVAEGIELSGQATRLRAAGCHHGQGFLYSQPLPASQIEQRYLQSDNKLTVAAS